MERDIVILGASSFPEIRQIISDMNSAATDVMLRPIAFLDDNRDLHGTSIDGIPVAGNLDTWPQFPEAGFVFAIGSQSSRLARHSILQRLNIPVDRFVSLIHPTVLIYEGSSVGRGCIFHPQVIVMGQSAILNFVVAMPKALVQGRCKVDKGAMLSPSVTVCHDASIGAYCHIGSAAIIAPRINIGVGAQVLVGSLVTSDVGNGIVCGGNPARAINREAVPKELLV